MTDYLLFTFAAPLASFGALAVGERRPTWNRPSKSQIIGLVAGCLGIERGEEARQQALADGLGFAVRIDAPGQLASDYHTAQTPKEVSIRRRTKTHGPLRTRSDELACDDLKTILSQREFIAGSFHTIALWRWGDTAPALVTMSAALERPVVAPFAGRKAHPLMLPMAPQIIHAATIEKAFALFDAGMTALAQDIRRGCINSSRVGGQIFTDIAAIPEGERKSRISRYEERRDRPESRAKWRFGLRAEALLQPAEAGT